MVGLWGHGGGWWGAGAQPGLHPGDGAEQGATDPVAGQVVGGKGGRVGRVACSGPRAWVRALARAQARV